jgi:membrane protease YdiL (CAAX protease family)
MEDLNQNNNQPQWLNDDANEQPILSKAERAGFPDWLITYGWILIAFIAFQVIAAIVVIAGLFATPGVDISVLTSADGLSDHFDILFLGNSLGQILAFGVLTLPIIYFVKRRSWSEMLPMKRDSTVWKYAALASLLIIVGAPTVWLMAWINSLIPLPSFLLDLERQQTDMIEGFLKSDFNVALAIFHVAMVPAICEEILYRGFALNLLRRTKAAWIAILITGIIFGFYHLRLSQVIPLAMIGIFLGWITIKSGSLIPAMVAHFVNNAFSVLLVKFMPDSPLTESTPEMPPIWLAVGSIVLVYAVLYYMKRQTNSGEDSDVWTSS